MICIKAKFVIGHSTTTYKDHHEYQNAVKFWEGFGFSLIKDVLKFSIDIEPLMSFVFEIFTLFLYLTGHSMYSSLNKKLQKAKSSQIKINLVQIFEK